MRTKIIPKIVVITTTHPKNAVIATGMNGIVNVFPIIPKATASETITPVSQTIKVSNLPPPCLAIFTSFF